MIDVTPLILTFNEEPNIRRQLESLAWAREVVVVDSGSTDATQRIVGTFSNARCVVRTFDNHAAQWSFGLTGTGITSDWVLALDADFGLTPDFIEELRRLAPGEGVAGFRASFRYCINGVPLRSGLYPPVTVLFRRTRARYLQDGHTQRVVVDGVTAGLDASLLHDDRKSLGRWVLAQLQYMRLEARKLYATPASQLRFTDRLRKLIVIAPAAMPVYCLVLRGGLLDGYAGLYYAMQRTIAEALLALYLLGEHLGINDRE